MDSPSHRLLAEELRQLLGADTARISTPGELFLVIGTRKTSRDEWRKFAPGGPANGEALTFDYVEERVVASGADATQLRASAVEYKRLYRHDMGAVHS